MAIAIDGSSPAVVRVASGTCTTASFTAPANSLLLALVTIANTGTATDTISDSGGLTWTSAVHKVGDGTRLNAKIWWAVTTSSTSRTVAVAPGTSADNRIMIVKVITGTHLTVPIGATITGNRTTSGTVSQSITSTAIGSLAMMVYSDGNGSAFPTEAAGTSGMDGDFTAETMAIMWQTALSGSVGETMTIADTAPSTAQSAWAVAEIVPPDDTSSPVSTEYIIMQRAIAQSRRYR